jgi:hypothetical protein
VIDHTTAARASSAGSPENRGGNLRLDYSFLHDVSTDGSTSSSTRKASGGTQGVYLRRTDGSGPVRLSDGIAQALAGRQVGAHDDLTSRLLPGPRVPVTQGLTQRA